MTLDSCILACGRDVSLLATRRLVLESAGHRVCVAIGPEAVIEALIENAIDLVVLCHTLSSQDCLAVLAAIHAHHPDAKILSLQASNAPCESSGKGQVVNIFDGPGKLVQKVHELIDTRQSVDESKAQLTPLGA